MTNVIPQDKPPIQQIEQSEHIGPMETGDNISAKKVVQYGFGTSGQWSRLPAPFIDSAYDYIGFSNPDGNDNYQTIVFNSGGSGGTTQRTLTLTYDGSSNVTSIARA